MPDKPPIAHPTFREALRLWLKLGLIGFGGPTGQIALMHAELVEKRRWISEPRFLHALNYCMLLPGPEATQLATYIGWLLHRTAGGMAAGILFVLPSAVILWILSCVYVLLGHVEWVYSVFYGFKPAVVAIVAAAAMRIASRALHNSCLWGIAAAAFGTLHFLHVPFPALIAGVFILGAVGSRLRPGLFVTSRVKPSESNTAQTVISDDFKPQTPPTIRLLFRTLIVGLTLWWVPVVLAGWVLGTGHAIFREGILFSKAAMVTFGGAYAVLPYVSSHAVANGWLSAGQMVDGLGLAETTPGPLIMVLQFVGFVGAWQNPGGLSPMTAATLGAFITTWTTFAPCFLWIFLGAPYMERARQNRRLTGALSAVSAAVVGVILNLAVWFAAHVFFPTSGQVWAANANWFAIGLSAAAFVTLWRFSWSLIPVILACGALGVLHHALFVH